MSKSLGNFITVQGFLDKFKNPDLLKLLFLSTHYSHPVDYTEEKIQEAKQSLERITILLEKINKQASGKGSAKEIDELKNKFIEAMDDDFNTPQALACIFELVNILNKNIENSDFVAQGKNLLLELSGILGLQYKNAASESISAEERALIDKRNQAKKERNFAEADKLRKELEAKGIILEDTKDGTTWRKKL